MPTVGSHELEIYVVPGCYGCEIASALAARVERCQIPGLEVTLVDLTAPDTVKPDAVIAVPTYLLDGRVISRGNPEPDELFARLCTIPAAEHDRRL